MSKFLFAEFAQGLVRVEFSRQVNVISMKSMLNL